MCFSYFYSETGLLLAVHPFYFKGDEHQWRVCFNCGKLHWPRHCPVSAADTMLSKLNKKTQGSQLRAFQGQGRQGSPVFCFTESLLGSSVPETEDGCSTRQGNSEAAEAVSLFCHFYSFVSCLPVLPTHSAMHTQTLKSVVGLRTRQL